MKKVFRVFGHTDERKMATISKRKGNCRTVNVSVGKVNKLMEKIEELAIVKNYE